MDNRFVNNCIALIIYVTYLSWCRVEFLKKNELLNTPCSFRSFYHATLFRIQHSPLLPSPFPARRFHFHISAESAGSLRVLMQQADGSVAILWSRSHNTVSHWSPELLPVGQHQRPYKVPALVSPEELHANSKWKGAKIRDIMCKTCPAVA